jgi:hypothetical protein
VHRIVLEVAHGGSEGLSLPVALGAVIALLIALVGLLAWIAGGSRHKQRAGGRHTPPVGRHRAPPAVPGSSAPRLRDAEPNPLNGATGQ